MVTSATTQQSNEDGECVGFKAYDIQWFYRNQVANKAINLLTFIISTWYEDWHVHYRAISGS